MALASQPGASAQTSVDLAIAEVYPQPAGPQSQFVTSSSLLPLVKVGGSCNTILVRVRNYSSVQQVESAQVVVYVVSPGRRTLWQSPGRTVSALGPQSSTVLTFSNVFVPSPSLNTFLTDVTLEAWITRQWRTSVDPFPGNDSKSSVQKVHPYSYCSGASGSGGTEPPTTGNPDAAIRAFNSVAPVFRHARCTTCHAGTSQPPQPHPTSIAGRSIGVGDCATCHKTPSAMSTIPASGVGGPVPLPNSNRAWRLAPASMRLTATMSAHDICQQVKNNSTGATDQAKAQTVATHVSGDDLVKWAFQPICSTSASTTGACANRPAAPGTHADLVRLLSDWASQGGYCP